MPKMLRFLILKIVTAKITGTYFPTHCEERTVLHVPFWDSTIDVETDHYYILACLIFCRTVFVKSNFFFFFAYALFSHSFQLHDILFLRYPLQSDFWTDLGCQSTLYSPSKLFQVLTKLIFSTLNSQLW
jgi:hypothetical protein